MRTRILLTVLPVLALIAPGCDTGETTQTQIPAPAKPADAPNAPQKKIQSQTGPTGIAP